MINKNVFKKFWFVSLLALFLAACGGTDTENSEETSENGNNNASEEASTGGELNVAYSAQPATYDPHMTTAVATSDIMRNVYETLVTIDADHQFQPMLAESYDISEDGLQITF